MGVESIEWLNLIKDDQKEMHLQQSKNLMLLLTYNREVGLAVAK